LSSALSDPTAIPVFPAKNTVSAKKLKKIGFGTAFSPTGTDFFPHSLIEGENFLAVGCHNLNN
jgi:hypothetical protein